MPQTVAFLGLGQMGLPMVTNLRQAGFHVIGFDVRDERMELARSAGVEPAGSAADAIRRSDWILTSLPSSAAFVTVAQELLVPLSMAGQVVIDLGTTTPTQTRRIATALAAKGVVLLDVPVSGGPRGVERRELRMFAAGERAAFEASIPLLHALGGEKYLTYCGESGAGQVVKAVNQLMMGLAMAAYLEAASFGVNAGVDPAIVAQAIGSEGWLRRDFAGVMQKVLAGEADHVGVKFRELPYFLAEAALQGFSLPLAQRLHEVLDAAECVVEDDHRPAPSYWRELLRRPDHHE